MSTIGKSSKQLWEELGDITTDEDGCIDVPFYDFPVGTDRFDIWHFLEERDNNFSVAEEMGIT